MLKLSAQKRLIALALCLAMPFAAADGVRAFADDTRDALENNAQSAKEAYEAEQDTLDELQRQQTQTQQSIDGLQTQAQQVAQQISAVYDSLQQVQQSLADAQQRLAQTQAELEQKQAAYDATFARTKQAMGAMQMLHDGGGIALLSQMHDLYQLLTFSTAMQEMSDKFDEMLRQLAQERAALEEQRAAVQAQTEEYQTLADELAGQQATLNDMQNSLSTALQSENETLSLQEADVRAQETVTEEAKRRYEQADAELDAYVKSQSEKYTPATAYCSLDFRCPLDSYSRITCYYGDTDPLGRPHYATDFAAPSGTPIHAAAAGVVSAAAAHSSYGNYVQISHGTADDGSRYDTLYAHMTYYTVSVGQNVQKGDVIGYVGTTGFSYGNHLHLELRINGAKSNALTYIPT